MGRIIAAAVMFGVAPGAAMAAQASPDPQPTSCRSVKDRSATADSGAQESRKDGKTRLPCTRRYILM